MRRGPQDGPDAGVEKLLRVPVRRRRRRRRVAGCGRVGGLRVQQVGLRELGFLEQNLDSIWEEANADGAAADTALRRAEALTQSGSQAEARAAWRAVVNAPIAARGLMDGCLAVAEMHVRNIDRPTIRAGPFDEKRAAVLARSLALLFAESLARTRRSAPLPVQPRPRELPRTSSVRRSATGAIPGQQSRTTPSWPISGRSSGRPTRP